MIHEFQPDEAFARALDDSDPLRSFRAEFEIPRAADIAAIASGSGGGHGDRSTRAGADHECIYMCGNSLGCMPRRARALLQQELDDWSRLGVEGHLHAARPWLPYHEQFRGALSRLVGAQDREVVAMNTLTANLHFLMVSFYRPTSQRYRIVIEDSAFPSDSYAVASQAACHAASAGFDPADAIVRLAPRPGEQTLRDQDIIEFIDRQAGSTALVLLGAVNYLTGQWFDMPGITQAARRAGCTVGWDLAHAIGNVPMRLHDWNVDFAAWCSYKYLNGGPGAIAGAYIHQRHHADRSLPRFEGWWANEPLTRFKMAPRITPDVSADAWSVSNPPILSLTPLIAALEQFDRAGITALREKSLRLTAYLEWWIHRINARRPGSPIQIVTPADPHRRGCHLSLVFSRDPRGTMEALKKAGVVCDFREPDVIRLAPVPLYNSFIDVFRVAQVLDRSP